MCGRFTLTEANAERVAEALGVPADQLTPDSYTRRFNIAPTDTHWIVRQKREDREALPDGRTGRAVSETAAHKR